MVVFFYFFGQIPTKSKRLMVAMTVPQVMILVREIGAPERFRQLFSRPSRGLRHTTQAHRATVVVY